MPSFQAILTTAALLSLAQAETIRVTARDDSFDPDTIEAEEGDVVEFRFDGGNHSVASGLYDFPCTPSNLGEGFFSGFVEADEGDDNVFRVTINSTDPIVFYSSQDEECSGGMVGIINPDDDHNLDDYREAASSLSDRGNSPPDVYGGDLVEDGGDDNNDNSNDDDDNNDNSGNDNSNGDDNDDDEGAASVFGVPIMGLLGAVTVAFALA